MHSRNETGGTATGTRSAHPGAGVAAMLLAGLTLAACASRHAGPTDAYLWKDSNDRVNVQTVDGAHLDTLPINDVRTTDLESADGAGCALDVNHVAWHSASPGASPDAHMRVPDADDASGPFPDGAVPMVRADQHGQCLLPYGRSQLAVLSAQKPAGANVSVGDNDFAWTSIDYLPASDTTALVGQDQFAVAQDVAKTGHIATVKIHGTVMGLTVHTLGCCARLSPDAKTLYSIAEGGDTDQNGYTVLAAFDTASGELKHIYLPYFLDLPDCSRITDDEQHKDCEDHASFPGLSFYSGKSIQLEQGESQVFDLSPDDHTLYVRAITNVDTEDSDKEQSQMLAIDVASGKVTPLPISAYGAFAVSASGKYLFVEDATTLTSEYIKGMTKHQDKPKPIQVYSLPTAQWIRELPGNRLVGAIKTSSPTH